MKRFLAIAAVSLLISACESDGPRLKGADLLEASRVNMQLGVDYLRRGLLDEAIKKLEKAVDQNPDSSQAHTALAVAYTQAGEADKAEDEYREAVKTDPDNPESRNNFGVFLCRQGKVAEAEKNFIEAARNPRYKTAEAAWTNAGACLMKTNPQKAEGYFRQALERNKDYPDALAQMANICFQEKDYWRARAFVQRHDTAGSPTAESLWLGVQIENALGNAEAARKYERQLRADFPESEQASSLLKSPTKSGSKK